MGQKGGTTQQTSSSSSPPPQVMAEYQGLVDRATNVANQPYQPYQGEQVAPLTSQTLSGLGGINQYANAAQPYLGAAGAMTMGASAPVNPEQFQGMGSLQNFMNPYTSSVVGATQAEMNNQNQQQAQFLNSANISSGAFGGDRAGIGQAVLANQQQLAEAPTIAGLNQANYTQAMQNWQNQQGVNLAAQQANRSAQLAGAAQLGQIGLSGQQAGLQGAQADIQAGMIPQQEQQAIDTAAQQMYQQGQAYPFTTTGWLGNIIEGTGGLSGGQSQTTSPGPNAITQGLGMASQGIGLLGSLMNLSDERAKENIEEIGKTYDGQNIYRYNFKGDPRTQIGLLAQEEAYRHPGSVKRIGFGDLLGVDYGSATEDAAERGHFADGGAPDQGPPPGGMTQGVTQGAGQPQQRPQEMSPGQALMWMGDPGARVGMGSFGLMGGTGMHPQPELPLASPSGQPAPPQQPMPSASGLSPLGAPLEPIFPSQPQSQGSGGAAFGGRQNRQGGGTVGGEYPIGMGSATSYTDFWQPGQELLPAAGVNEALFEQESAGSKNPYTGIDIDQINAIGGGQWMPPQTGATMPDFSNLQKSPQFGAAEASLGGQFGGGYTPGSTTLGTAPAANAAGGSGGIGGAPTTGGIVGGARSPGAMGAAGATQGGLSRGQLANLFDQYFGGASPAQTAPSPLIGHGGPGAGPSGGGAGGGLASGGGVGMNDRSGFQFGGFPGPDPHYTPTTGNARGPATYVPAQAPPAIQIQRQLQGKARAKAAVQRGMVRPRVIAPDPVTGQHHDITPQPFQQPAHPSTMRYPMWPTPPQGSGGGGGPLDPNPFPGPPVRFGAKDPYRSQGTLEPMPREQEEPPLDESWKSEPYGGHSTNYGPQPEGAAAPEPMPSEGFSPGSILRRLPGFIGKGAFRRIPFADIMTPSDELAPPSRDEAPRWSWPKPQSPDSGPTIHAPAPGSHVTDLGTWEGEGGAPGPAPRGAPPGPFDMAPPRWGGPPPADLDSQIMQMGDEGPQRFRGGRIGRDDGGAATNMPYPGQQDPGGVWGPKPPDDSDGFGGLSDADWEALAHGRSDSGVGTPDFSALPDDAFNLGGGGPRAAIDPRAVALAPSFQSGDGGGGGGYRGDVTSFMGGPPITAGHFVPTTGNARGATYVPGSPGAGISPNARAQAPEHPAITTMRHIVRAHDAARSRAQMSHVDPNWGPNLPPRGSESGGMGSSVMIPYSDQPTGTTGSWARGGAVGYQGGGGVLGASPVQNAGGYTPQGYGLSGQTSQGGGLGSIAQAKTDSGFGDLFGGGERAGFASGGLPSATDPFLAEITASIPGGGSGGGGRGPPAPPQPAPPPPAGQDPTKGLGDNLGKLGDAVKKFTGQSGGQQTAPTGSQPYLSPADQANMPDFSSPADQSALNLSDADFAGLTDADLGFATGGGVGLGALRGNFQGGGDAEAPSGFDEAITGTAPAPAVSGGAPAVPDLIKQNFGERAGYASTISQLESGQGKSYVGDGGSSFGPFQLHMGGLNKDMPHPGLGDTFREQTGLDPRDPKTVPAQIKFVADYTAKHGWNDWSTKGQADKIAGADVPSASAQPVQAGTESYGGGFQLPGPTPSGPPPGQLDRSNLQAPTMGDELRHDPFGYMMTVGSAMMASRSPWLGVGIGEGLEAGNRYLQSQKELEKSWGTAQAQINQMSQDARDKGADADLKAQQLQIGAMNMKLYMAMLRQKGLLGGPGDGSAAPSPTGGPGAPSGGLGGLGGLGTKTGVSGAPGDPSAPSGAAPSGAAPTSTIPDLNQDPAYKAAIAKIALGKQQNIVRPGLGDDLVSEGTLEAEAAKANWEKTSEIAAKGSEAVTSATTEAQKPVLQAYLENREKFESTYDQTRSEISELSNIYQRYQSGRAAEAKADIASWANEFGFKFDQAASADAAMKSAIQQAFAAVANSGLQKAPRAGLKEATMMVASPTRDPAALRKILTDQLATLDYQHDMYTNVPGHNLNVGDDMDAFTKKTKYSDYLNKARKEVPIFKGITPTTLKNVTGEDWPAPLPKTGAQPGERYSLPNGKIVRAQPDGTLQVEYEP